MSSAGRNNNSTNSTRPGKPYPGFPLFAHASGQWAKKIRGRQHYFGVWADPQAALTNYLRDKEDLEAGRRPRLRGKGTDILTVQQMVWGFLEAKKLAVECGEMEAASWTCYKGYGERMIRVFGPHTLVEDLTADDFERYRKDLQKTHKTLESLKGDLTKTKVFFNWAGPGVHGRRYLQQLPCYGDAMRVPARRALLREKQEQAQRVLSAAQIRRLLAESEAKYEGGLKLRAMILLGVNCAFGNMDCAKLTVAALDLAGGWANFPRPKTGTPRRCPLWPQTVAALEAVLAARKLPRDAAHARRLFVTKFGQPFLPSAIGLEFEKLAAAAGMDCTEADFYDLRRTCISIGIQVNDDDAVRTISGHQRRAEDMLGVYNRIAVSDERLRAVSAHIQSWLGLAPALRLLESGDEGQPAAPSESVV